MYIQYVLCLYIQIVKMDTIDTSKFSNAGKFKTGQARDKTVNLRLSQDELDMIDKVCKHRKESGAKTYSRTDVIVLSVKYAMGELSLLDRMEMNLMEGKGLFDSANFPTEKYQKFVKLK